MGGMRGCWLAVCLAAGGCNAVFGLHDTQLKLDDADTRPDLDHDGIADVDDPCIAAMADGIEDLDMDAIANKDDGCPLENPNGPDGDGDGVPDVCDAFAARAGDRHRCTMRFLSADLDNALWRPRAGSPPWSLSTIGGLQSGSSASSVIATETIEAPATTEYDLNIDLTPTPGAAAVLGVWVRAGDPAAASDVGCVLRSDTANTWHLELGSPGSQSSSDAISFGQIVDFAVARMRVVVEPAATGANLRCAVAVSWNGGGQGGGQASFGPLTATAILPAGSFALANDNMQVVVNVLSVYDRDDAPPL